MSWWGPKNVPSSNGEDNFNYGLVLKKEEFESLIKDKMVPNPLTIIHNITDLHPKTLIPQKFYTHKTYVLTTIIEVDSADSKQSCKINTLITEYRQKNQNSTR